MSNEIERLYDVKQVASICSLGVSTVWKLVKEETFPAPVKLSRGITRWKKSDLENWLSSIAQEGLQ